MVPSPRSKSELLDELVREFRAAGNQDRAFDSVAAELIGVNETDLHCLNIIENSGGLSAGELAALSGLTPGAVTGVIDRLEKAGFACRLPDPADRRRVRVEVTSAFYAVADRIWGPTAADWQSTLGKRFTVAELECITDFLRTTSELGRRHLQRLRDIEGSPRRTSPEKSMDPHAAAPGA